MKSSTPGWCFRWSHSSLPLCWVLLLAAPLFAAPDPPGTTPTPVNPLQFRSAGPMGGRVYDLSDNGIAVVGRAPDGSGFRWRMSDGTVLVGYAASDPAHGESPARGVTATGGMVMGWDVGTHNAYLWTSATGTVLTDFNEIPTAISADGSTIVGGQLFPRRWSAATGPEEIGVGLVDHGTAYDVSSDGSYIVGEADFYSVPGYRAFRWHPSTGMMSLGNLARYARSRASGVSANGAVVVGYAYTGSGSSMEREAFRWTRGTGMVGLGTPPFADGSAARDVSADGVLIVGEADVPLVGQRAILWDAVHGMRYLQLVLESEYGLGSKLQGWTLLSAVAVASGTDTITFAGNGTNPEGETQGWWARVTKPLK